MTGIPTVYQGVAMRSRTEARWANLFDELRIHWQYEPIDLIGYVPDFILEYRLLAEIKSDISDDELLKVQRKIDNSGWYYDAVILTPIVEYGDVNPIVGSFGELERGPDGIQRNWSECRVMRCLDCGAATFFPGAGDWRCRWCGANDGNSHVGAIGSEFDQLWTKAGNRVQWRAA